ncbi:hypothetical protein ABW20_dc0104425 [Dactylellina cionopaga]|nr:hypothetical protein ABW20_dc0104425 [Dactylellina cionopaga]
MASANPLPTDSNMDSYDYRDALYTYRPEYKFQYPDRQPRQRRYSDASSSEFEPRCVTVSAYKQGYERNSYSHLYQSDEEEEEEEYYEYDGEEEREEEEEEEEYEDYEVPSPQSEPPTPLRFLNLAGYTDKSGRYFYPACSYRCLSGVPGMFCSPPSQSCICTNSRLLDELGVCVKLDCVHSGDMDKFWRVMGRECDGNGLEYNSGSYQKRRSTIGTASIRRPQTANSRRPQTANSRRPQTAVSLSRQPTLASEVMPLTITVTKTVSISIEAQPISPKSVDSAECRTVCDIFFDGYGKNDRSTSVSSDKSFWGVDSSSDEETITTSVFDEKKRRKERAGDTGMPARRKDEDRGATGRREEPDVAINVSCHEVVGFLKRFGMTPKKVAGVVKKVRNAFGRVAAG